MYRRTLPEAVGAVVILAACVSAGLDSSHRARGNRITLEEIEAYAGDNVYLLIQSHHANWLQPRDRTSASGPVMVYVDDMPQPDGVESLRTLDPLRVQEILYLDSREATNRFGTGHGNGAILVKLR